MRIHAYERTKMTGSIQPIAAFVCAGATTKTATKTTGKTTGV